MEFFTAGNEVPDSEKKRVLISMHPCDRFLYFSPLAQSILNAGDCAVCFSSCPADSAPVDFSGVCAVVAAVSEKYLTWKDSGFVSEALAAIRGGVPVLPLLLEEGIENLFNTRCGQLHFLKAPEGQLTGPLLDLLNTHITALLADVPKKLPEGRIFISYRKQDIGALVRFVHALQTYQKGQRVSIWYDKSLNPGENFRQEISLRLKECDLFLLLVTPHLLEEGNYVMRVEYPMAVREKKRILPVLAQKTDLSALRLLFPGIPKCVTVNQPGAVLAALER